ncbi:MAG: TetR family transcriptional regulator [Mycobacterium sp.]|jgi:AcrR family transcriptional regulator|nr:TetR family transcriptional regulator [Mycobacterium sp.]
MVQPSQRMAEAVLSVLVSDGFEGVSVRKVAASAGMSIGAVQHHFPTKDAMLAGAMELAAQRFQARLAARLGSDTPPAAQLEELAVALISCDDREVSVAWLLRLARAAVDDATAERHRADWAQVATWLQDLISAAAPHVDADDAAVELLALLDGLACSVAVEPGRVSAEAAERIARSHVQRITGPARAT